MIKRKIMIPVLLGLSLLILLAGAGAVCMGDSVGMLRFLLVVTLLLLLASLLLLFCVVKDVDKSVRMAVMDENYKIPRQCFFQSELEFLLTNIRKQNSSITKDAEFKNIQLHMLMSQINPHFLYNTLESIRGQAIYNGDEIVGEMAETLSKFFRYCISRNGTFVALEEEIRNVKVYLKIMKFRFQDKFEFQMKIENPGVLDCEIPKLTLQPIMENALLHGIQPYKTGGIITLRILECDDAVKIYIRDNGVGIPYEKLHEINRRMLNGAGENEAGRKTERRGGIALYNINRRIKLTYGSAYGVRIFSTEQVGTNVLVSIPYRKMKERM